MAEIHPANYSKEAFAHPANLGAFGLLLASALAVGVIGGPVWLLLSAIVGAELLYLGTVPRTQRFRRYVQRQKRLESDDKNRHQRILQTLNRANRRRYFSLQHVAEKTKHNFSKLDYTAQGLLNNVMKQIEELLQRYLYVLEKNQQYVQHADESTRAALQKKIEELKNTDKASVEPAMAEAQKRRLQILEKRYNEHKKAAQQQAVSKTNLQTIEDTVQYMHEQSMTLASPGAVDAQLVRLLEDMQETADIVRGMQAPAEPLMQSDRRDGSAMPATAPSSPISTT